MKEYGAAKRPIRREREKFKVARAERKRPRRRRQKHCKSINSCFVGLWLARRGRAAARRIGSGSVARVKAMKVGVRELSGV